ncbi:hypothetical protein [Xanthocytophaga agilis]|uniref:Uncharacterized protein n=1 Tax=Xanthocytophaga agilis TaxID=3048010 RepID=A0AAE3UJH8_9BACT|nr:hypothetical protein [Xanthocytophaga agilis]MDJ1505173.1 hypothetical protein [Xanthocytophaga agilis]
MKYLKRSTQSHAVAIKSGIWTRDGPPVQRRKLAHWLVKEKKLSQRKAAHMAGISRRMLLYQSKKDPQGQLQIQILSIVD